MNMTRGLAVGALVLSLPVIFLSCSSGGGGGESTNWNLAGTWHYTLTVTGDPCGLLENELGTCQVTQSGNNVTVVVDQGATWTGTIDGETFSLTFETDLAPDCRGRGEATLNIQSNNQMSGHGQDRANGNGCGAWDGCTAEYDLQCGR